MADRELLELAAKAAGIKVKMYNGECFYIRTLIDEHGRILESSSEWNPLTDDGDALRLVVELHLLVVRERWNVVVVLPSDGEVIEQEIFGCPYAATRRAIVRAAAEIGKVME